MQDLHEHIGRLIAHLTRVVNKFKALDKKSMDFGTGEDLAAPEIHAVEAIGKGWVRTASDLVGHFAVTKGAVSQVLAKLERRGYLNRTRNPRFGKEKLLELTTKGQAALAGHEAFHQAMDTDLKAQLAALGIKSVYEMDRLMELMERHIDKYLER